MSQNIIKVAVFGIEDYYEILKLIVSIEDENPKLAVDFCKILRKVNIADASIDEEIKAIPLVHSVEEE